MKFGDKLIKLRKGRGLSQEDLASMLNVSRQSVSKWESNNTYPETDKIVQICNIFDCSMDSLIDESIVDIEQNERKSKSNFNIMIDSLLGFITKTINMLSQMKFTSILKCIIEQLFIAFGLFIISSAFSKIVPYIICHIFIFLSSGAYNFMYSVLKGVCEAICLILSLIVIIHIFKIRYLNYYDKSVNTVDSKNTKNKDNELGDREVKFDSNKKEEKIVFRDPNHEPFAFLSALSKIVIYVIKFCVCFVLLFVAFILIFAVVGLVISLYLSIHSIFFVGTSLSFVGGILLLILVILLLLYFVINKKVNIKIMTILALISLLLIGIGGGVGFIGIKNFKIADNNNINKKEDVKEITYEDNMIITNSYPHDYSILIDNNMVDDAIIIKNNYIYEFENIKYDKISLFGMKSYTFYSSFTGNYIALFDDFLNDLKNNTIRDYFNIGNNRDMRIVANEKTALKLMNNFSKVYLYSQTKTADGYIIFDIEDKIEEDDMECGGYYSAVEDKVICPNWCSSKISREKTEKGIKIYYSCTNDN